MAEAVDSHIGGWFWNAAARARIRPVAQPQYDYELLTAEDADWQFTATVPVQPKVDVVDWTQLEVGRPDAEVPEELVVQELDTLRESVAELVPAGERLAREGDTLVVDIVSPDGEAQRDTVVELGPAGSSRRSRRRSSALRPARRRASPTSSRTSRPRRSRSRSRRSARRCCPSWTTSWPARRASSTRSPSCAPTSSSGCARRSTPRSRTPSAPTPSTRSSPPRRSRRPPARRVADARAAHRLHPLARAAGSRPRRTCS